MAKGWAWGQDLRMDGLRGAEAWTGPAFKSRSEGCSWGGCPRASRAQGRARDGRHHPAPHPQPSVLRARPGEAGNVHPEGRAPPAGRQAGRPPALHLLPTAAACAPGEPGEAGRAGQVGRARWGPLLRPETVAGPVCRRGPGPRPPQRPPASACCASLCPSGRCCCSSATGRCR